MTTDLITIKQFTELYNMKKSTVYQLIQSRALPHYRFTERKIYFRKSEVEDYLTRNRVASQVEIEEEAATLAVNSKIKGRSK